MNYYSYKDYMEKQKVRIELFFKYNYKIDSLTFTKTEKNPMGTLVFYGYFNGDKENDFSADIMSYQKEFENNNAMSSSFARENANFENGKTYTVSEIEKIQRKERRENSDENSSSWFSDSAGLSKYSE
ncbi:DUF1433 domain-containing protein [Enterococcus rotai]|uniref:DUF1433 domain-containing protein n=1 Tax=Enterococcus rotai TaxID=118060 RepID=UPI0032B47A79